MTIHAEVELADTRIAIFGLGLMGGSLALALQGHCRQLLGVDCDPNIVELAWQRRIVDRLSSDPAEILPLADLVILAAPIRAILAILNELPVLHPGSPVVIDLGSTKVRICQAMAALPPRFEPVGGHPMCGKETSSLVNADPGIFHRARFALVALPTTGPRAVKLAIQLAQAVGADPFWLDSGTHDRWVASTSHLPYLVSNSLAGVTPVEAATLIGPGYRSTTRLAVSSAAMMREILETNRENVLDVIKTYQVQIQRVRDLLDQEDFVELERVFQSGNAHQREILASGERGGEV